ncbi:hypothetical protein [uncultured Oscillibacter sp.]|uniref:hypothetical protein n=1 Tax=uncultured Oscillibacter sp. TaxID=876091 RepID=UPI00280B2088|nr:hypothetical protein [uncultured Oscillibacter sp.]
MNSDSSKTAAGIPAAVFFNGYKSTWGSVTVKTGRLGKRVEESIKAAVCFCTQQRFQLRDKTQNVTCFVTDPWYTACSW